ncbi:MAG: hypothetical protein WCP18_02875 [bacterium]
MTQSEKLKPVSQFPERAPVVAQPEGKRKSQDYHTSENYKAESQTLESKGLYDIPPVAAPLSLPAYSDVNYKKIEHVLEDGLGDYFFQMNPSDRQKFKIKGEETAIAIAKLIAEPKLKLKKVISFLRSWLKLVPGINRFFLEQTVKIKTDKILKIAEEEKKNYFL